MKSKLVWMVPAIALIMVGSWGGAWADTSEVKLPSPGDRGKIWQALQRRSSLLQSVSLSQSSPPPMSILGSFSYSRRAMRSIPT